MSQWRAGGRCPLEDCSFEFYVGSDEEAELDVIAAHAMQKHSDLAHEGLPVNLFGFRSPEDIERPTQETEERPRLIN